MESAAACTQLGNGKYENPLQLGGIRTGSFDYPNPNGGQSCRVAHVNTGSGLRLVVVLDRGADLGEASFNDVNLAFLSQNDYKPPSHAYHRDADWLAGWPGGLLTTCGPGLMGEPRQERGQAVSLHGRFSNTPAALLEIANPDPAAGRTEMRLVAAIRDARMFGPTIEVRRMWRFWLGEPRIVLEDEVCNRGDEPAPHGMLYHINFGYPLLDEGTRLAFGGRAQGYCMYEDFSEEQLEATKLIPPPEERFRGANEGLLIVEPEPNDDGWVRTGIFNPHRAIGVEVAFPLQELPRLANWQHFGPRGSYVTAIEPFNGSLFGVAKDRHPRADLWLAPGESRRYQVQLRIRRGDDALAGLRELDGPLTIADP